MKSAGNNRFVKHAETITITPRSQNWFNQLPPKVQAEIIEASNVWTGKKLHLAEAIKAKLDLSVTAKEVAARLEYVKKQIK